ncbi:hypothetical protein AAG612_00955 [Citromicrobium bathyomarinum]|uniref:2'-5' RNA ligase family protein n=1 Tax=Citromicrobium bathyomarinum TaxID=72174 RepID=UPI00315AF344
MQPKELGIALVFNDDDSRRMLQRQQVLVDEFGLQPDFGLAEDIPHLTLMQLNSVNWDVIDDYWQNIVRILETQHVPPLIFDRVIYKPTGWYFWLAQKNDALQALHEEIVAASGSQTAPGEPDTKTDRFTQAEKEAYETYGYRYAGSTFLPHVTLGKLDDENPDVVRRATELFSEIDGEYRPAACTLYEKGPFGSHRHAQRSHALDTRSAVFGSGQSDHGPPGLASGPDPACVERPDGDGRARRGGFFSRLFGRK